MKKVTHLVNSASFLKWIQSSAESNGCKNSFVLLDLKKKNLFEFQNNIYSVSIDNFGKKQLLNLVNQSDITIHYFLDYTKSELIINSNKNVLHYWYFFGGDVYQQINSFRKNIFLSETKKWMRYNLTYRYRIELRNILYKYIKRIESPEEILILSINRIENILWYIEDEIDSIAKKIDFPKFCYHKFFCFKDIFPFEKSKLDRSKNKILLGNSAAVENNHLDFLPMLIDLNFSHEIAVPFSYGDQNRYKKYVKKKFFNKLDKQVSFIEELMPLKEYYNWLNGFPTAIMLHNRQQALGNIFYLIANGTKVYMSDNNIIFDWLEDIGVSIFSFEKDFKKHYNQNDLILTDSLKEKNYKALKNELSKESNFYLKLI